MDLTDGRVMPFLTTRARLLSFGYSVLDSSLTLGFTPCLGIFVIEASKHT